jgi:hypothetical protein
VPCHDRTISMPHRGGTHGLAGTLRGFDSRLHHLALERSGTRRSN